MGEHRFPARKACLSYSKGHGQPHPELEVTRGLDTFALPTVLYLCRFELLKVKLEIKYLVMYTTLH